MKPKPVALILALLLAATAPAPAETGVKEPREPAESSVGDPCALAASGVKEALRDLESPFFEARRRAILALAGAGGEGETAMRRAYPHADFRTKALILDGFVRGRPEEGTSLVFADLATTDRGVVLAQRRLISALYGQIRRYAGEQVLPRVSARDWRTREGVRALPGMGASPAAALRRVAAGKAGPLRVYGRSLTARVGLLTELRERLASVVAEGDERGAERAGMLLARLLRHDTERALLAVYEESARHGSFDGMYAVVSELVRPRHDERGGPDALDVLLAILKDEPMPEDGIPPDRRRGYVFLEPLPPDGNALTLRNVAAAALGDVGDGITGAELSEYFDTIPWNSRPEWQDDEDNRRIDDSTTPKLAVAVACATLGATGPLEKRVKYQEEDLKNFMYGSSPFRRQLALAYARLGEYAKAAQQYRYCLRDTPRDAILRYNLACALARSGDDRNSLQALRIAVANGYGADPSQITWVWRDKDLVSVRRLEGFRELFGERGGK